MSGYMPDNFKAKPLNIGLDFDGTVTADPELWLKIVKLFRDRGHKVYVVTYRYPHPEKNKDMDFLRGHVDNIFFTSYTQKRKHMSVSEGIYIDIWIDDMPELIP
ncbi:MAG TPA: HAD family hydrolase [Methanosarcina sp.]|nr:HAD family hydrolase [Methanosarcina sp.]